MGAELLVILSDVNGLYDADPHKNSSAKLIERIHGIPEYIFTLAGDTGSTLGTGGMKTKLNAAKICVEQGVDMVIANGESPALLYNILDGKMGNYTRFYAK